MSDAPRMAIAQIKIGKRFRKDMGDLAELARSMSEDGLVHPVVVNSRDELVAGQRRLQAAKLLGWTDIPCNVAATFDEARPMLLAERNENVCRQPFTGSEAVTIGEAVEAMYRPEAEAAQADGRRKGGGDKHGKNRSRATCPKAKPVHASPGDVVQCGWL